MKVVAGDVIDIHGKSYYLDQHGDNSQDIGSHLLLSSFLGVLGQTGSLGSAKTGISAGDLENDGTITNALGDLFTNQQSEADNNGLPKAFINYIVFDEQMKVSQYGFSMVGSNNTIKDHFQDLQDIAIAKNGYIYVYCSNESDINVYFDNLQVVHTRSPLVEETHYYPFGLTMAGISSKAATLVGSENKQRFNGYEQQNKEFSDGSGLEWYDYKHRFYDNQIGRFFCVDRLAAHFPYYTPYQFAGNQVTIAIDLDGDEPKYMIDGNGHLTNPMKSLLHAAFGYSMSSMNKTTWKAADFPFGAITSYRTVKYDKSLSSAGDVEWGNLVAHEQKHRDEIGNDLVGAMNWYVNYGVGYVGAGFNYENNPSEARAYAAGGQMDKLMNFGGGVALKVLQGSYEDDTKSETLNFIGLAFNLSEQTSTLSSMQDKLKNFTGSDKAKHRLERRIERQQKRVDAASQEVQEAITDTVVDTLNDVNKFKN